MTEMNDGTEQVAFYQDDNRKMTGCKHGLAVYLCLWQTYDSLQDEWQCVFKECILHNSTNELYLSRTEKA